MNDLQTAVIGAIESIVHRLGKAMEVSNPKYSEDFRCEYFEINLPWAGIMGVVFPADANFWDGSNLDERFERIDFDSDIAMCRAITDSLTKALPQR